MGPPKGATAGGVGSTGRGAPGADAGQTPGAVHGIIAPMSALSHSAPLRPPVALLCVLALGCGPTIRHTLATSDQRHITYEDLCHLQSWYDHRTASNAPPFRVVDEQSTETAQREPDESGRLRHVELGEGTYLIASREDRLRFNQLLRSEYDNLPSMAITGAVISAKASK